MTRPGPGGHPRESRRPRYTARQYDHEPAAILGSLGLLLAVGALTMVSMPGAVVVYGGIVIVLIGRARGHGRSTN